MGFDRSTVRSDLGWAVPLLLCSLPLAMLPDPMVAAALWDDPSTPHALMMPAMPLWRVGLAAAFPLTIVVAELPTYFGYVYPRLRASTGSRWGALLLVGAMASAQHVTLPLVFDARFVAFRLLTFLPLALFWAWALDRRPTLLPFAMIIHGLLDGAVVVVMLLTSLGIPVA